jgi:aminoglycoside phosphotransferase (APT) family kinase protein
MTDALVETAPVRSDEQMDWPRLAEYLAVHLDDATGPMEVLQFPGGSANLTYLVSFRPGRQASDNPVNAAAFEFVVRRPPLGPLARGAHDMVREHKVLSRLYLGYPKAPRCLLLCEDESVIGAKFIVCERRQGVVVRDRFPAGMTRHTDLALRVSGALVDAMAELHNLDPAVVDLLNLGRPDGFVERQISGWYQRWQAAKHQEVVEVEEIYQGLRANLPKPQRVSILHNDLKLDNCQFAPDNPDAVTSVFDWDMATLGDPLIDMGTLLGYWPEPGDSTPRAVRAEGANDEFPSRSEITARYAAKTGLDTSAIWWYEAFALWKTAVVLQQMYIRFRRGQTHDERFAALPERIPILLDCALALVRSGG